MFLELLLFFGVAVVSVVAVAVAVIVFAAVVVAVVAVVFDVQASQCMNLNRRAKPL